MSPVASQSNTDTDASSLLVALADDEGREAAWAALVERFGAALFRQSLAICGDPHLAEDACQEALLQIRDGARRFRPPRDGDRDAAAAGWIRTVGRRTSLAFMRRRCRALDRERRYAATQPTAANASSAATGSGSARERAAGARALRAELALLPAAQREALVLHYLEGKPYAEVARETGCSPGNARVRAHRGIQALRSRLAKLGCVASATALAARLPALTDVGAATAAPVAKWTGLIHSSHAAALPATAVFGGLTMVSKCGLGVAALLLAGMPALPLIDDGLGAAERRDEPREEGHRDGDRERDEVRRGRVAGTVHHMEFKNGVVVLYDEEGEVHELRPRWIGGAHGGLDEPMLKKIRHLRHGDRVRIGWIREEGRRIAAVEMLGRGPEEGVFTGTLVEVDGHHGVIHLETDDGRVHRLSPHWRGGMPADGGGLDEETIRRVREFGEGDYVDVAWRWAERLRIEGIREARGERPRDRDEEGDREREGDREHGDREHDEEREHGDREHDEEREHGDPEHDEEREHGDREHDEEREHGERDHEHGEERHGDREGDREHGAADLAGFSGQIRGVVVLAGDDGVAIRVARVLRTWKDNRARNPEALRGRTVVVGPAEGNERHERFLSRLRTGSELSLEIRGGEGGGFRVLELSESQRRIAGDG